MHTSPKKFQNVTIHWKNKRIKILKKNFHGSTVISFW